MLETKQILLLLTNLENYEELGGGWHLRHGKEKSTLLVMYFPLLFLHIM